jgi:hypothetical protein
MTEREPMDVSAAPASLPVGEAALLASIESLRGEGARHLDPVRFHYLEVLARRMQAAPDAVRHILQGKLRQGLADCGERLGRLQSPAAAPAHRGNGARRVTAAHQARGTPLAGLNGHIETATRDATPGDADAALSGTGHASPGLKSAHRFREAWSRIRAEDALEQAVGRGPENAGPLNSHMLVLRSLTLMRELSPDYLRRFLSQVDSLLWLEQAQGKLRQPEARARQARRGRPGK